MTEWDVMKRERPEFNDSSHRIKKKKKRHSIADLGSKSPKSNKKHTNSATAPQEWWTTD